MISTSTSTPHGRAQRWCVPNFVRFGPASNTQTASWSTRTNGSAQNALQRPFVRDPATLVRTLRARPDYLHTLGHDEVVNYSEWGVPLGRQFRALKLWFVLRAYGLEGLRAMIRNPSSGRASSATNSAAPNFEIVTEPNFLCFRFVMRHSRRSRPIEPEAGRNHQRRRRIYLTQNPHRRRRRHPFPGRPIRMHVKTT